MNAWRIRVEKLGHHYWKKKGKVFGDEDMGLQEGSR